MMARVKSLERRGVRMVENNSRQGAASSQSGGMFSSNKETVRKLVEEELRGKVPRNKSFKQAVGAGVGGGGEQRTRRRKSLEEQLLRNTEVRLGEGFAQNSSQAILDNTDLFQAVAGGMASLSKSSLGSSRR